MINSQHNDSYVTNCFVNFFYSFWWLYHTFHRISLYRAISFIMLLTAQKTQHIITPPPQKKNKQKTNKQKKQQNIRGWLPTHYLVQLGKDYAINQSRQCIVLLKHPPGRDFSPLFLLMFDHFNGLVPDCSTSSALTVKILQSCTNPSIWFLILRLRGFIIRHLLMYLCIVESY